MSRKKIEDIFSETLNDDQAAYREGDWEQMNRMLNDGLPPMKEKRRRRWLLLLFPLILLCCWLLWNNTGSKNNGQNTGQYTAGHKTGGAGSQPGDGARHIQRNNPGDNKAASGHTGTVTVPAAGATTAPPALPMNTSVNTSTKPRANTRYSRTMNTSPRPDGKEYYPAPQLKNSNKTGTGNYSAFNRRRSVRKKGPAMTGTGTLLFSDTGEMVMDAVTPRRINVESETNDTAGIIQPEDQIPTGRLMAAIPVLPDTLVRIDLDQLKKSRQKNGLRRLVKNALGMPQWIYAGYGINTRSSGNYIIERNITNSRPFTFSDAPGKPVKTTPSVLLAAGSEWYPSGKKWSVNSYLALQFAEAQQVARTAIINGSTETYTGTELIWVSAVRAGADWVRHSANDKWQFGAGLNVQYVLTARGKTYYYYKEPASSIGRIRPGWGVFSGINQFNIGVSAVIDYRLNKRFSLAARGGWDMLDMTRKRYFNNNNRNNLTYFSTGIKFMLSKER